MKRKMILICLVLFHIYEILAVDIKGDTTYLSSVKTQIFSDETTINSFCCGKKLTINKGEKENCLITSNYLESIFTNLIVNNQRVNPRKFAYCVKDGMLEISGNPLNAIQKLDYYIITLEKEEGLIGQYIYNLKNKSYEIVIPAIEMPYICYLFMKGETLVVLSHELSMNSFDEIDAGMENKFDIKELIEIIKD
jgi:hypothetical protein